MSWSIPLISGIAYSSTDQGTEVKISKADLGVEVTSNFLQKDPPTYEGKEYYTCSILEFSWQSSAMKPSIDT